MKKLQILSAVIGLSVISIQAQASIIDLNLTGTVSQTYYGRLDFAENHTDYTHLELNSFSPVTVQLGDTINTTITFDQSITIPSPILGGFFSIFLRGDSFPNVNTTTSGSLVLSNNGTFVFDNTGSLSYDDTNSDSYFAKSIMFSPLQALTFNSVSSSFIITDLSGEEPVILNTAFTQITLFNPNTAVPVPGAAWLFGSGLLGLLGFKKRKAV